MNNIGPANAINPKDITLELSYSITGDFRLKTLIRTYIVKREELMGQLFLMGIKKEVREALEYEINELVSNYWEFDKDIIRASEWIGGVQ
jgi:hypothetical protein